MPIDFVEESEPKIDFVPDEQTPSLDRELEREDLRRQMREARAEAYGNKAILGLADLGERAAYTASLMDPLTAVGRVINPRQQSAIPAEAAQAAIDFLDPFGNAPVGSAREGVKQFAAEMVSGLAQPEAAAAMMTGKINPQLPGRLFQPGLIKASPQAAANLAQAETPAEAVKSGLELGLAVGGTAGIEAHGAKAGKAKPTDLTETKPEVTEPKPAVEEPLPKPSEPISAAKEEPKPAEPAPVEAAVPVTETAKPTEVKPESVTEGAWPTSYSSPFHEDYATRDLESYAGVWGGTAETRANYRMLLEKAVADKKPVSVSGWTTDLRNPPPEGYVREGDQFVYKPTPPPPSPEAQAKPAAAPTEVKPEVSEGKTKQPWEMTKAQFIESEAQAMESLRKSKFQEAINNIEQQIETGPRAVGVSKVLWLLTRSKRTPLQKRLMAQYEVAKRNAEADPRVDNPIKAQVHERLVRSAVEQGKPVPAEVLADYPDLAPKPPPPQPSAGIEKQGKEGKAPIVIGSQAGVPTESMLARRDFLKANPSSEQTLSKKFSYSGMTGLRAGPKSRFEYVEEAVSRGDSKEMFLNSGLKVTKAEEKYFDFLQKRKSESQPPIPGLGAQTAGETQPPQIQGMGGATPSEFAKGQGSPTAMKYRLIDQERQKRGLEPLSKPDRISDQKTMDKAIAAMDQNPNLPDQLIQELRAKPRAIEDWENHVLLLRKIELREEYHKAAREAMQAYADSAQFPERLADMQAANARTQFYSEKLTELEQASRVAGSARGRALRALRVMANEDFSLASLEMEKRAANNWRPLTPDERAELIKIADEHKAKSEELQKRLDELEKEQQDKEVGTVLTNLKAEVKRNPVAPTSIDLISGKIRGKLEKDPKADIRFYVRKIARFFVSQGTKERDVLVDQVHGVLSGIIPDLDRRTTMDLISGYGDYSRLPKDTVSVILRDLSGQMQQIAKLEDMMRGEAPLRSGQERRTPSDVERILQKQVEEQKKKGGYTVTDPETQLRTAQEAVQKRLQNQITDLELQIQTRQKIIKNPTKLQYDSKSNQLKARRDELKAVYDEIFAKPAKTEAERLAEWKERTKDRIDELKEFLAGTKQPKQKPTPVVLDKEALRIRFDLHTIERLWREKLAKEKRDQWTRWQKAKTIPAEVLNVSRALLTSFDFSAPGRQGIIIGLAHPIRAASALRPMFEAWRSEKGAFDAAEQIRNRNNAPLYEIGKLYLAEHGGRLSRQEEAYMSRWASKIPGIRASERAYVTFLNRLRADSFDSMVEGLTANGTANPAELKAIANFINVATGRGVGLERSGTTLNTVFFAPRYVFSRFQFLAGQPLYKGTAATRKAIAKEYGKFLAGAAVVYALASSAGADVGTDPRSSDFGKIIIGNTRIDPMAGLNQVSTLVGRTVSGETKPIKGRAYPIVGKVPYGKSNLLDVMMNFGRGKLSPAIGTGISLRLGKDVANQPFGVSDLPKSMGVPISWQDMYSAMREEGVPAGIAMGMLSMFGIGVNTYEQQNRR